MSAETLIKVSLVILFLLYAYFMIGGYTPCPGSYPCPGSGSGFGSGSYLNTMSNVNPNFQQIYNSQQMPYDPMIYPKNTYGYDQIYNGPTNNTSDKNIYQMSPYLT